MKDKVTVYLRRKANGDVVGEIMNDRGAVVASKHFGTMTEEEYRRALKQIEQAFPDVGTIDTIELIGNQDDKYVKKGIRNVL